MHIAWRIKTQTLRSWSSLHSVSGVVDEELRGNCGRARLTSSIGASSIKSGVLFMSVRYDGPSSSSSSSSASSSEQKAQLKAPTQVTCLLTSLQIRLVDFVWDRV